MRGCLPCSSASRSFGSSRFTRRKWPKWLDAIVISKPSSDSALLLSMTPAFKMSLSIASPSAVSSSTNFLTDLSDERSRGMKKSWSSVTVTFASPARCSSFFMASRARPSLRQAKTTFAPARASASAVSKPIPVLQPVITIVLPLKLPAGRWQTGPQTMCRHARTTTTTSNTMAARRPVRCHMPHTVSRVGSSSARTAPASNMIRFQSSTGHSRKVF
mmetsp:Transcript_59175/g.152218  ORF Transcript_59175/g.152218 Transcript_59175/m.152218 type:complete len:217 (+) Transcript_59175:596-1246(+)